jgi:hypothetical protein
VQLNNAAANLSKQFKSIVGNKIGGEVQLAKLVANLSGKRVPSVDNKTQTRVSKGQGGCQQQTPPQQQTQTQTQTQTDPDADADAAAHTHAHAHAHAAPWRFSTPPLL